MRPLFLTFGLCAVTTPLWAADHGNLETGFPLTIEDAYPVGKNAIEVQTLSRYIRLRDDPEGDGLFELSPRLEWGALPNFQLSLEAPYFLGDGSMADSGEVGVEGLYNFNTETLTLPALSLAAGLHRPYGQDGEDGGLESSLTFLSTLSLGAPDPYAASPFTFVPRQVHLNATWSHNFDPLPTERDDRYLIGVGYSQPLSNDLVLVADVFRETEREEGEALNAAEVGARYIVTPQTVVSAAAGVGFGGERTEDFRITIGLQHALSFPY